MIGWERLFIYCLTKDFIFKILK